MSIACQKALAITVNPAAPVVDAYWTFDEAAGNAVDKVHGIILTPANAPGTGGQTLGRAPALFSNGLNFFFDAGGSATPQIFNGAFAGDNEVNLRNQGNGFSWTGWFKYISTTGVAGGVSSSIGFTDVFIQDKGEIDFNARANAPFWAYTDALGVNNSVFFPNLTAGVWVFFHFFYDATIKRVGFSLNNAAPALSPDLNLSFPSSLFGTYFMFGNGLLGASTNIEFDEFAFKLSRPFTAAEVTYLYNGGAGRTWPL
jgi:hypothetical protein